MTKQRSRPETARAKRDASHEHTSDMLKDLQEKVTKDLQDGKGNAPSYLAKARKRIVKRLDSGDADAIATQIIALTAMLKTAISLTIVAEQSAHKFKNDRGMYSFVAVATMVRDLLSDIARLADRDKLANKAVTTIIDPNLTTLAQHFTSELRQIQQALVARVPKDERKWINLRVEDFLKNYLALVKETREDIRSNLDKMLDTK